MAFMSEFELPQEVRDRLETLWRRVTAPQTKNLLWERHLSRHAGLGASLEECLAKRDLVGAWILTRRPHPSPPLAVLQMAEEAGFLDAQAASQLRACLPAEVLQPYPVPPEHAL